MPRFHKPESALDDAVKLLVGRGQSFGLQPFHVVELDRVVAFHSNN